MAVSDFNLFVVNSVTAGFQQHPSHAQLANGNIVVVWDSGPLQSGDSFAASIKARIFDPQGSQVVGEFTVSQSAGDKQTFPEVVALSGGRFVVTWTNDPSDPSGETVMKARIFDPSGSPLASEFALTSPGPVVEGFQEMAPLSNGGFIVTWTRFEGASPIVARIFDAQGNPTTGEFQVNQSSSNQVYYPTVVELAGNRLAFAWQDEETGNVRGRVFNGAGNALTDEYAIGSPTPSNFHHWPQAAALVNGNQAIAWMENEGIIVRVLDHAGIAVTSTFNAVQHQLGFTGAFGTPEVVALSDGGFVVAWVNFNDGVRARVFNADGTERVPEFDISPGPLNENSTFQEDMEVVELADGRLMFTWANKTGDGDGDGSGINGVIMVIPTYDYETGTFISLGTAAFDDLNGILVQDKGQDDLIFAMGGDDMVDAGAGDDQIYGDGSVVAKSLSLVSKGSASQGKGGKDILSGQGGKDEVWGGSGKDKINGGTGNDILKGGGGKDTFIFEKKGGVDKVKDFRDHTDRLDFEAFKFKSKGAALKAFKEIGSDHDSHIVFKAKGTSAHIYGLDLDDLGGSDLII